MTQRGRVFQRKSLHLVLIRWAEGWRRERDGEQNYRIRSFLLLDIRSVVGVTELRGPLTRCVPFCVCVCVETLRNSLARPTHTSIVTSYLMADVGLPVAANVASPPLKVALCLAGAWRDKSWSWPHINNSIVQTLGDVDIYAVSDEYHAGPHGTVMQLYC